MRDLNFGAVFASLDQLLQAALVSVAIGIVAMLLATAIGTVASPTWIRSMRAARPVCRCIINRPFRLKEQRHPSLRLVASMCSSGRCGSSKRLVCP